MESGLWLSPFYSFLMFSDSFFLTSISQHTPCIDKYNRVGNRSSILEPGSLKENHTEHTYTHTHVHITVKGYLVESCRAIGGAEYGCQHIFRLLVNMNRLFLLLLNSKVKLPVWCVFFAGEPPPQLGWRLKLWTRGL